MNTKNRIKKTNNEEAPASKTKGYVKWIVGGVLAVALVVAFVIMGIEQLAPKVVATAGDEKILLKDVVYDIYQAEVQGNQTANWQIQLGTAQSTSDYWNMTQDDGLTVAEQAKQGVIDSAVQTMVLYKEAKAAGYKATKDEKKAVKTSVETMLNSIPAQKKKEIGIKKAQLTDSALKTTIVNRFHNDKLESFEVDEEGLRAGVDKNEFRQYNTEYFFIGTTNADAEDASAEDAAATKEKALKKMKEIQTRIKDAKDWSKVLVKTEKSEDENTEASTEKETKDPNADLTDDDVYYSDRNFIASGDAYDDTIREQIMKMSNGEVSDIIEGEDGYYIVRMNDNNSDERYEQEVSNAISEAKEAKFKEYYAELSKDYKVTINNKIWDDVTLGSYLVAY
ncbi:MAG: hypothetical protein K6G65_09025 [Lachnospiraceae bacterium]|nr:hypothetical protein [Lachnospiraceae bacterium]